VIGKLFLSVSAFVSKELVHLLAEQFQTPVNKPKNVNVNYLKIPKKHHGPYICISPCISWNQLHFGNKKHSANTFYSFCFVLTRLHVYISFALICFQNKQNILNNAKIGMGQFSSKVPVERRFNKKV